MDNAKSVLRVRLERPEKPSAPRCLSKAHLKDVELHSASNKGQLSFHYHFFFFDFMYRDVESVGWNSF